MRFATDARYGFRGYTRIPVDEVALSDPLSKSPLLEAADQWGRWPVIGWDLLGQYNGYNGYITNITQ